MHLIEYIGGTGIKTTDLEMIRSRWDNPKPGDVVDFELMEGKYPFLRHRYGTVDQIYGDEVIICCEPGSIFLGWHDDKKESYVSISGGPFERIKLNRLQSQPGTLHTQSMWNWGDNSPGAHQGVHYKIDRPVFVLNPAVTN